MNSEIKYPYIGYWEATELTVLFVANREGLEIGDDENYTCEWSEHEYKNITHEYLSNTWGVVESKEHAEFIVEIAKLHGFELARKSNHFGKFFSFDVKGFFFLDDEFTARLHCKKITIPLPPKPEASVDEMSIAADELTTEEETELKSLCMVSALNNEIENQKTWPQVGDKVTVFGRQGVLVLPADANGMYVVESNGRYFIPKLSDITKPKSKQDLLIEELQAKLVNNNAVDNYILACDIINGDIEGLIYNPEESK